MNTMREAEVAVEFLQRFINGGQLSVMFANCAGEEGQFFIDKLVEMAGIIRGMPKLYSQDGMGDTAIVRLHYFINGFDWWLTELDVEEGLAFGLCDLGCPELGNVSTRELVENRAELDLYWTPKPLARVMK